METLKNLWPFAAAFGLLLVVCGIFASAYYTSTSDVHGQPGYAAKAAEGWAKTMGEENPRISCGHEWQRRGGIDYENTPCNVRVVDKIYTVTCFAKTGTCGL